MENIIYKFQLVEVHSTQWKVRKSKIIGPYLIKMTQESRQEKITGHYLS